MTAISATSITSITYYEKETLFDITFNLGYRWALLAPNVQDRIMGELGGSRGLAEQAMLWAEEFQLWMAQKMDSEPFHDGYLADLDAFFDNKWDQFIAGQVAKRMTEGGKE